MFVTTGVNIFTVQQYLLKEAALFGLSLSIQTVVKPEDVPNTSELLAELKKMVVRKKKGGTIGYTRKFLCIACIFGIRRITENTFLATEDGIYITDEFGNYILI